MKFSPILVALLWVLCDADAARRSRTTSTTASTVPTLEGRQNGFLGQLEDPGNLWDHIELQKLDTRESTWRKKQISLGNSTEFGDGSSSAVRQSYPGFPDNPDETNELPNPIWKPTIAPIPSPAPGCLGLRGQYPSPKSCANYLNCWDDVVIEETCPNGLLFNDVTDVCDFDYNVNCGDRPLPPPKPPLDPGAKYCPDSNGRYRSSTNCSEFYVCLVGKPIKFSCPRGLVYNDILNVCDYLYNVDCKGTATPKPPPPPTYPPQQPTLPTVRPTSPPQQPSYPPQQPSYPPQQPSYPPQQPSYPPQQPSYPPQQPAYPPQQPSNPPQQPSYPPQQSTNPPQQSTSPPIRPTNPPSRPTNPPSRPTNPPTRPTNPPTRPTNPPTRPTSPPTRPTNPPTKPTNPPTRPTNPPTRPTNPPTRPTSPPQQPSYPPQQPSYPPQQPAYPPQQPSYPPQQPSYPPQQPSYPPQQPSYPPQQPSYPPQQPSYPPQQPSYPPQQPSYPQNPGYPPQQPAYPGNPWLSKADTDPWHQRPVASQLEIDTKLQEQEAQDSQSPPGQLADEAEPPTLSNPWDALQAIPAGLGKVPCTNGELHRLNESCTSVVVCRNGRPQLVQCSSGYTYDKPSDSCRPFTIAKC